MQTRWAVATGGAVFLAVLVTLGAIATVPPRPDSAAGAATSQTSALLRHRAAVAITPGATVPTTTSAPSPTGAAAAALAAAQHAADALYGAGGTGARLSMGAAVLDATTGELAVGPAGNDPYYSASVVKLIVAVDIVDRDAAGEIELSEDDDELLNRMLATSDDEAMNALWSRYDGAGGVSRVAARLGLTGTTTPADPSQWGGTRITARDIALVYLHLLTDPDTAGRDLITNALYASSATATDGFDQAFGLWGNGDAVKQGWQCCYNDSKELHSTGVAGGRYISVLLTDRPDTVSWPDSRAQLTTIAEALRAALPA